jgi:hypothetical protein
MTTMTPTSVLPAISLATGRVARGGTARAKAWLRPEAGSAGRTWGYVARLRLSADEFEAVARLRNRHPTGGVEPHDRLRDGPVSLAEQTRRL